MTIATRQLPGVLMAVYQVTGVVIVIGHATPYAALTPTVTRLTATVGACVIWATGVLTVYMTAVRTVPIDSASRSRDIVAGIVTLITTGMYATRIAIGVRLVYVTVRVGSARVTANWATTACNAWIVAVLPVLAGSVIRLRDVAGMGVLEGCSETRVTNRVALLATTVSVIKPRAGV